MRLIVGLGNPGPEYVWTPHNLGFLTVDRLAGRAGIRIERPEARALLGRGLLAGEEVLLAKPQTMMNLSGLSVRDIMRRYELGSADVLVVHDDVALPWGMIRIRERGSAGGHNGLKSVIGALNAVEFVRVRLGVQPEHSVGDLVSYVLRPMRKVQLAIAAEMVDEAADAVELILGRGVTTAMNRFNKRVPPAPEAAEP